MAWNGADVALKCASPEECSGRRRQYSRDGPTSGDVVQDDPRVRAGVEIVNENSAGATFRTYGGSTPGPQA